MKKLLFLVIMSLSVAALTTSANAFNYLLTNNWNPRHLDSKL